MNCASCGHDNPGRNRFCGGCGDPLEQTCAACGHTNPPDHKFCGGCGQALHSTPKPAAPAPPREPSDYTPKHLAEKILQSRSALEGERKQVTVLFVDVKGSMDLANQLDPEEWHQVLDRFFAILGEGVHRFEGTINQYTGDGIMALFGAPIAHEDHAQRACYAAIHMRAQLRDYADRLRIERGVDFGVRMGINSGDVVVGRIGDDLRMDYTAQGHTVGLAQRIEQIAGSDRVCLSEHTQRLVQGYFELRDLGKSPVAGADEPIGIFELEGVGRSRTRLDVSRSRGLTQFVGRSAEMQILHTALARARAGHGQVVGVVGEPGLGKSRLCYEFVEYCRAQDLPVYEAHCPAHGKNIPFLPILELFRNYFDIQADDNAAQARKKIAGTLLLLDPSLQEGLPILFEFMGVADPDRPAPRMDAAARQQQIIAMLHQIYRINAEQDLPNVVLIDDLHWVDPGSDAFVAQLVAGTEGSRSLLLLNFRPEYEAAWMRSAHYQQLPLVPLGIDDLREMVQSLLGTLASVQTLAERIIEWTGGNPFYTEEVIQSLIELGDLEGARGGYRLVRDVGTLAAPANVRSVLAARIDRLPDPAKQLLQTASVIGKEFSAPMLASVDGFTEVDRAGAIEQLKSGDFVFERALYPTTEYAFKHPLTQEVAYDTLLKNRRTNIHQAVAESITTHETDKLDENAALLAYHWERAEKSAEAAEWHRRAAIWAGENDPQAAERHWQRVRELLLSLPGTPGNDALRAFACASLLHLAIRVGITEDLAEAYFDEARELSLKLDDKQNLALLYGGFGMYRGVCRGYADEYRTHGIEGVRLADLTDNEELKYISRIFHQFGAMFSGRFNECVEIGTSMIDRKGDDPEFGRQFIPQSPLVTFLMGDFNALLRLGDLAAAERTAAEIRRWNRQVTWSEGQVLEASQSSMIAAWRGEIDIQLQHAQRAVEQGEQCGSLFAQVGSYIDLGIALFASAHLRESVDCLETAENINKQTGAAWVWHGAVQGHRAKALLALGDLDEAYRVASEAVEFCRARVLRYDLQPWLSLSGTQIRMGDKAALATLEETQQLIDETCARMFQPFLHELRAEYAEDFASDWIADHERDAAYGLFVELGMTGQAERLNR